LVVNGLKLGVIDSVGPVLGKEPQSTPWVQQLLHRTLAQKCVQEDHLSGSLRSYATHDLALTLVGGSTFDPSPVQKAEGKPVASIFDGFVTALDAACQAKHSDTATTGSCAFAEVLDEAIFARCVWAIRYACINRRFFTISSRYIDLGPQASHEGDVVCFLAGSRVPIVLRPAATEYEVVGPCYVHGMMQGEAAALMAEDGLDQEQFVLR